MPIKVPKEPYMQACETCGEEFRVLPCDVRKNLKNGHNPPRFCSVICRGQGYKNEGNPKWRGGRQIQASGYIYIHAPDHPYATKHGTVMEHRLVMEAKLGRYLDPEEVVHHINHVRDDNRIKNLELSPSQGEHRRLHGYYEERRCATCGAPVTRSRAQRNRWSRSFCSRKCAAAGASAANAAAAKRRPK